MAKKIFYEIIYESINFDSIFIFDEDWLIRIKINEKLFMLVKSKN